MAGLSYGAINVMNNGYSGSNPSTEYAYGMGLSRGGYDVKKLEEQLKLQRDTLAADFLAQGWGGDNAGDILSDITGYKMSVPKGLTTPADTANIGNLMKLLNAYRYTTNQAGRAKAQMFGGGLESGIWNDYASGFNDMIGKGLKRQ